MPSVTFQALIQDLNKLKITCADGGGDFKPIVNLNVIEFLFFFFCQILKPEKGNTPAKSVLKNLACSDF